MNLPETLSEDCECCCHFFESDLRNDWFFLFFFFFFFLPIEKNLERCGNPLFMIHEWWREKELFGWENDEIGESGSDLDQNSSRFQFLSNVLGSSRWRFFEDFGLVR